MGNIKELAANREKIDDKQIDRVEAIINSMTPHERRNHQLISGSRRKRISKGSGTSVEEINRLLKQFVQMKQMLKQMGGMAAMAGKKKGGLGMLKGLRGR
jgi:signal recognition particle subunit SRP54